MFTYRIKLRIDAIDVKMGDELVSPAQGPAAGPVLDIRVGRGKTDLVFESHIASMPYEMKCVVSRNIEVLEEPKLIAIVV
jgi:hypothetical protein